ncbi:MAG: Planctomycete cytochrome [Chthoniobacteraceae bacterium]|nr:Planctomycete cytochrome [Chthoniobacteraceae bacterium]
MRRTFVFAALLPLISFAEEKPVSFFSEVVPILKQNCNGCHRPGKTKGGLDLSNYDAVIKGGKHGLLFHPGDLNESELLDQISGESPEMPKDADPLSTEEQAIIRHWISQGAKNDTPAGAAFHTLVQPPIYHALPAVTALAWSPDGSTLAVSGFHEVILWNADGSGILGRLQGNSTRIESLTFSPDGKWLATAGGAPSEYGEIQIWDVATRLLSRSIKTTADSVFGVSFSPDAALVAVGCADKTVRAFSLADGKEVMKCDSHIDWVYATTFSHDGKRIVSASRDRAVKLIDVSTGHLIDDVNQVRDVTLSLARHPTEDLVVFGDEKGGIRIHRMEPRGGRLAEGDNKENSYLRECDRMPGAVHALAWSPDGSLIAAGALTGETQVFKAADGKRLAAPKIKQGAVFALAFDPASKLLATAGYDGKIRIFTAQTGEPAGEFDAVPLAPPTVAAVAR